MYFTSILTVLPVDLSACTASSCDAAERSFPSTLIMASPTFRAPPVASAAMPLNILEMRMGKTWGGMPKAIPKGPPKSKSKPKADPTPDEDEEAEEAKDEDQEDETDPKKARLYLTWKATGCPVLPKSSWGGWGWYLKQKDS